MAERVNSALMESIASGKLSVGDRLPSERELCEQFGVSRTVIREAIRGLQAKGVLRVQAGRGVEVVAVPASHITEAIRLFVHGFSSDELNAEMISEVRRTLETRMVELACERATDEDISKLQRTHRLMDLATDVGHASEHDVSFHRHIASATQNVLFVVLLDSVGEVLMEIRRRSLMLPGRKEQAVQEHQRVLDAIIAKDINAARAAMEDHLGTSQAFYTAGDNE